MTEAILKRKISELSLLEADRSFDGRISVRGGRSVHSVGSNKEVAMQRMGRIGLMGLGIALAGCLSVAPAIAGDKPANHPLLMGRR